MTPYIGICIGMVCVDACTALYCLVVARLWLLWRGAWGKTGRGTVGSWYADWMWRGSEVGGCGSGLYCTYITERCICNYISLFRCLHHLVFNIRCACFQCNNVPGRTVKAAYRSMQDNDCYLACIDCFQCICFFFLRTSKCLPISGTFPSKNRGRGEVAQARVQIPRKNFSTIQRRVHRLCRAVRHGIRKIFTLDMRRSK